MVSGWVRSARRQLREAYGTGAAGTVRALTAGGRGEAARPRYSATHGALADRYELGDAWARGGRRCTEPSTPACAGELAVKRVELLAGHEEVEAVRARALREAQPWPG